MEKTYKRVPFNIELAKDIQSGKVEGRIVNVTTEEISYTKYGSALIDTHKDTFIELHEEAIKHEFKPFDKVLVRDAYCEVWRSDIFSFMAYGPLYSCLRSDWHYCIPFEGNEHLVGTTDKPKEE